MKITFVATYITLYGGSQKFLLKYANALSEKGHSISIVCQKIDKRMFGFNDKISLIEVGGPLPSSAYYWLKLNAIKRKYLNEIYKLDSDMLISLHFPTNYFCTVASRKRGLKHVNYCFEPYRIFHDKLYIKKARIFLRITGWFLRRIYKRLDLIGTQNANAIICISKFIREKVQTVYHRTSILHYIGVITFYTTKELDNLDLEQKLKLKKEQPIIFTFGLTHHMKGCKELVYIFNRVLKEIPKAVLLIGGWMITENHKIIKKTTKNLKIPKKNVRFLGFIQENELSYIYSKSRLTLSTAIDESYGLIPIESMYYGTPIIAFEGGPSETIINGQTGFIIKNNDILDFTEKAIKLITNNAINEKFSKNGKDHVRKRFNFENSIKNLEKILQEINSKN